MRGHLSTIDAVALVARCGGVPVLAHPLGSGATTDVLDGLVAHGLRGLEIYSPYHDDAAENRLRSYCQKAAAHKDLGL